MQHLMQQQTSRDWELLRQYTDEADEKAFSQLVCLHIDMVYSAALRQVHGDRHLAEEVTQVVFIVLARRARTIRPDTILAAWLHKTTRFTALNVLKVEARRKAHERKAAQMTLDMRRVDSSWKWLSPVLDEGIARLSDKDRAAVLLRFFEQKTLAETGEALGVSEDAAGMRISRAVDKLRNFFRERGVTLTSSALGGIMTINTVQAAPHGLGGTVAANAINAIARGAAAAHAVSMVPVADAVVRAMAIAQAKAAAIFLGCIFAAGAAMFLVGNYFVAPLWQHATSPMREEHTIDLRLEKLHTTMPIDWVRAPELVRHEQPNI